MIRKYPGLYFLCFVVAGIVFADVSRWPAWFFLLLMLLSFIGGVLSYSRLRTKVAALTFGIAFFAFASFHFAVKFYDTGPNHISNFLGDKQVYHIYGEITDWPELKTDFTEVKISLDSIVSDRVIQTNGSILLKISTTTTALQRGDCLEFYGRIYPLPERNSPGHFNYSRYLKLKGVFGTVYLPTLLDIRVDKGRSLGLVNLVDKIRLEITGCFKDNLSPSSAALASGFLIGETRDIPQNIYTRFRDSGTLHLLAVSGSNVAMVLAFFVFLMKPFSVSRWKRSVVLLAVIMIFTLLSYADPSVVRASIMASLVILAGFMERRFDLNNIISLTALIILLYDPMQLYDVGFQLSFITAWGLIFFTPRMYRLLKPYQSYRWYRYLVFPIIIAFIAQVCSAPVIAFYFHRVPLVSIPANLCIIPLVTVAVVGTLVLLLASLIWPILGLWFGSVLNLLMEFIVNLLNIFGSESTPMLKIPEFPPGLVLGIYVYLILAVLAMRMKIIRRVIVITLVLIINLSLCFGVVRSFQSEAEYYMHLFSVPGGVAMVVDSPGDRQKDLVITGLHQKDYRTDEVVIAPVLENIDVKKLRSLFLMDADYGAFDDILRLAGKFDVDTLYLNPTGLNGMLDARSNFNEELKDFEILPFWSVLMGRSDPGYRIMKNCFCLQLGETRLVIADKLSPELLKQKTTASEDILIIGSKIKLTKMIFEELKSSRYSQVVCQEISVSNKCFTGENGHDFKKVPEQFIYDLNRLGAMKLSYCDGRFSIDVYNP